MAEVRVLGIDNTDWGVSVHVEIIVDGETLEVHAFSGDNPRHSPEFAVLHRGVRLAHGELAVL